MSSLQHHEPTAQKRKMSHSDHIDDGTPPIHVDPALNDTPSDADDIKVAYNGPASIHVVMLRVSNESSARPMPQAAFFDRNKALAFSTRILLQWCEAHYDDYLWKGPESLRGGLVERYAAYHAQTGQQLAVADVIRVSVFDANETEVVLKKEDKNEKDDREDKEKEEGLDEAHNAEHQEEGSEENLEGTETTLAHSAQAEEEEIDLGCKAEVDKVTETLSALLAHGQQAAPGMYAMGLATRLARHDEQDAVSSTRRHGAWREDHEMRVFGDPTE
ncbi:hypothetical protein E4T51_13462 [Aureobasidium sp. EXF-12344]|nr:hypothetical protein E4T51_13462 [Aureobasidium sp. EXF-12344]